MSPAIHTGSAVFVRSENSYGVGDIVTFQVVGTDATVTHRIVSPTTASTNQQAFIVKGDANDTADSDPVLLSNIIGKVFLTIPLLGYLLAFVKTLPGLILFILLPSFLLIRHEFAAIAVERRSSRGDPPAETGSSSQ